MSIRIAQKTLERLEWPQVMARLRAHCRTPLALRQVDPAETSPGASGGLYEATLSFEGDLAGVRNQLAETSEARGLLENNELPPISALGDLERAFRRAEKGGVLTPHQLLEIAGALCSLHGTARFLRQRGAEAPRLMDLARGIQDERELERDIGDCIDASAEVRNGASAALRQARSESQRLAALLQDRLARYLQNREIAAALSDDYYTVRNDRYVLPVRADSRGRVPGIVHDASNSGTTLFVEPEAVVELNNQLKQAELSITREVERVLRDLSEQVAEALGAVRTGLDTLALIDLAFARARLSVEMNAVEPRVEQDSIFELHQLRHPLLPPDEVVPNDLRIGDDFTVMVISGPNGGGKTVAMKALALSALFIRVGLHVPAAPGARVDLVDEILADIGDDQNIRESLSTFSAHMANLARIVNAASPRALVVLDEVGVGTDPGEGAALGQAILERLADCGARVIATTHYNLLKEMAAVDPRFRNASFEFDPDTLAPTYRLQVGEPGVSSATAVAARMGMSSDVLDRANTLLERDDRRLDQMLSELASSRAALEAEQREVTRVRSEGESVREAYRAKLERLQERRDKLFHAMREDLDRAFKDAHARVAGIIRDLQRGGSAQAAARARSRLLALADQTRQAENQLGIHSKDAADGGEPGAGRETVDWSQIAPGESIRIPGGRSGVLESLPDRRGKVRVRVGAATLVIASDLVAAGQAGTQRSAGRTPGAEPARPERAAAHSGDAGEGGTLQCDLRGCRVDEALDSVADALDRATREQRDAVLFIHGFGTGALRKAVREHLSVSPYVADFRRGDSDQGGDGVTLAELRN